MSASAPDPTPVRSTDIGTQVLVLRGNLQRDLLQQGIVPCAIAALALIIWLTFDRIQQFSGDFDLESQVIAGQLAALASSTLEVGQPQLLQNIADTVLQGERISRIEINAEAGIFIVAGAPLTAIEKLRVFVAPIATPSTPGPLEANAEQSSIGQVRIFRETGALVEKQMNSLLAGVGLALALLVAAWGIVHRMARTISQPLERISQTVAALESGSFETRCNIADNKQSNRRAEAPHELASLAYDIDRLAKRLQRNQQISDERVQQATAVALQRMADAEQAAQSRTRFLASASHDLRQPLHAMGLFIDGLRANAIPAQQSIVLRLQESVEFMGMLLNDLLEISRLDAQVLTPTLRSIPLEPLFEQLAAQHAAPAAQGQVRLVWRAEGHTVLSDTTLLLRILGNLVSNAIRRPTAPC